MGQDLKQIAPFTTTGIGSMPHTLAADAVELALSLDVPFWPQLPALGWHEQMVPQYSEGMPGLRVDEENARIWVEHDPEEIDRFYEASADEPAIAISQDYARGYYKFIERMKGRRLPMLKGQITGPLTFTLGLRDATGKDIFWDEELREISLMLLEGKARWQVQALKNFADEVIMFFDEPILSGLGTAAYMGVSQEEAGRLLTDMSNAIFRAGGIPAIHCCGRADWPLVMNSGISIMNFDAYGYGDTLALYPEDTTAFLERGGILAWGIVPTGDEIRSEDASSILRIFEERKSQITAQIDETLLMNGIMLTPSCGTGPRTVEETMKVFQLLMTLKEELT